MTAVTAMLRKRSRLERSMRDTKSSDLYFARIPAGLEGPVVRQLTETFGARARTIWPRTVIFESSRPCAELLAYRGCEDLFRVLVELRECSTHRSFLLLLTEALRAAHIAEALRDTLRAKPPVSIGISASFRGRRNYNRFELADAVFRGMGGGFSYVDLRAGWAPHTAHLRLHLDGAEGVLGLRLGAKPLHKRSYKVEHAPGSLNPVVAYHLVELSGLRDGDILLDPCCGVATVPIEAQLARPRSITIGSDIDAAVLSQATGNAQAAGLAVPLIHADACRLPLQDSSVTVVATDLPWGHQTHFAFCGEKSSWAALLRELSRVLIPGGMMSLLAEAPGMELFSDGAGFSLQQSYPISLFGRHPVLYVLERCL